MFLDFYVQGNMLSGILLLLTLFAPLISLVTNSEVKAFVQIVKSKGYLYIFVLLIAFIMARGLFLLWTEVMSIGIENFYDYSPSVIDLMFFTSSVTYWMFVGKVLKVKDKTALLTVMYIGEIFWLLIFSMLSSWILSIFKI